MKKFLGVFLVFSVLSVFLVAGSAMAFDFTYNDTVVNWPTSPTGTDTNESIGTPVIKGAIITVTGDESNPGTLQSITIDFASSRRVWDALFINTGGYVWDAWDFIVYDGDADNEPNNYTGGSADIRPDGLDSTNIYAVNSAYDYVYVDILAGREGHVNGIANDDLGSTNVSVSTAMVNGDLVYTFSGTAIALAEDFVIGYTPWCANDVLLTPISEPSTMLLLGAGLIGLAGIGRRKFFKK